MLTSIRSATERRKIVLYLGLTTQDGQRISTDNARRFIQDKLGKESYTLHYATGYWNGKEESTVVVTHICEGTANSITMINLANSYKKIFNQEAVLMEYSSINIDMI